MSKSKTPHEHDYVTACFDCGHISRDGTAYYADGTVLPLARAAATTPAPQLHWPFAAKHPNCDECAKEYEAPPAPVAQEETK